MRLDASTSHARSSIAGALMLLGFSAAACAPEADGAVDIEIEEVEHALTLLTYTPTSFSMANAYHGTSTFGTSCSLFSPQDMVGHEPTESGRYPVAVWLTGTQADFAGGGALEFTRNMAALGFVAASVEYTNWNYASCSTLKARASCIFNGSSSNSAIAKLCARAKADCSKGIVVAGISQGANLASLAKNYDARARAAYLLSNVVTPSIYNNTSCLQNSATAFLPSQVRLASGEADEWMSGVASVRSNLVSASGYSCTGMSCMQADGSGWYIVSSSEVADGKADHCYLLNDGCDGTSGDPTYASGTVAWAGWPSIQWLASKATR